MKFLQCFSVLSVICFTCIDAKVVLAAGRSYALSSEYLGYTKFLAWTLDTSLAPNATTNNPALYMAIGSSGSIPAHALWMVDDQDDNTFRIYAVDNSYSAPAKRLDISSDGSAPVLSPISSNAGSQVWELYFYNDDSFLQVRNQLGSSVLDILGSSTNEPFMNTIIENGAQTNNLTGQAWYFQDETPTSSLTATSIIAQTTTITPAPITSAVGGTQVTITSVTYSTITVTVTSTRPQKRSVEKRSDALTIPTPITVTSTVSTLYLTQTITKTLATPAILVTTGSATNTVVAFQTSFVTTTITIAITGTSASPATTSSPPKPSHTALAAGLGAGLGFLFVLLLALGFLLFRRRRRNNAVAVDQAHGGAPEYRRSELPSDVKDLSNIYASPMPVQSSTGGGDLGGRERLDSPMVSERSEAFHATASPVDLDAHAAGYGNAGRHELGVHY